jgi:hypothetical protein
LNTLFFNSLDTYDDLSKEVEQLLWLEEQLMNSTSTDKFILISHIYESANYNSESFNNWAENARQTWFYQLLWAFRDRIILEVNGHDHISDLRTHSANKMFNHGDKCVNEYPEYADQFFASKLINPGITPTNHS